MYTEQVKQKGQLCAEKTTAMVMTEEIKVMEQDTSLFPGKSATAHSYEYGVRRLATTLLHSQNYTANRSSSCTFHGRQTKLSVLEVNETRSLPSGKEIIVLGSGKEDV